MLCSRNPQSALRWMSRPEAIWKAEFKPFQLELQRNSALRCRAHSSLMCKAQFVLFSIRAMEDDCKTGTDWSHRTECVDYAVYTTKVAPEDLEDFRMRRSARLSTKNSFPSNSTSASQSWEKVSSL